jgi:streptogramin lyase
LAGTGVPGFVDGDGTAAQFSAPEGITVDLSGSLYVADSANARVRKVLANGITSTFAGPAGFLSPRRIALHSDGNFYMVDPTNDNLQQITPAGVASPVFYLGGILSVGISPPTGGVYVADTQTCTIVKVNGNTSKFFSGSDCGFQDGAAASAKYASISDIAFDDTGNMFVADKTNYRIRKVANDGSVSTFAGSVQGHTDGVGDSARFVGPTGLTVDNQQHILYVADGTTIRAVAADGTVTTVVGSKAGLVDGDGCAARFGALQGITYFAGALYAVDLNRIRKVTLP